MLMAHDQGIVNLVNAEVPCYFCHRRGTWQKNGRKVHRENSAISWLQCSRCGCGAVAKQPLIPRSAVIDRANAEYEFSVLSNLQSTFPQNDEYGTLTPIAYLRAAGVLITRRFDGQELTRYLGKPYRESWLECCYGAGVWLRRLHDAYCDDQSPRLLGMDERLDHLERTYQSVLARNSAARCAYSHLSEAGSELKGVTFRAAWSHGDFKPANLLYNGRKYVGIDTWLRYRAAVQYDIATFLDHLLLDGRVLRRREMEKSYKQAEVEFLAGYDNLNRKEMHALRWLQVYFMLSYWMRSQCRSRLRAYYGSVQMLPLLRRLQSELGHI
jgi:hypothetical protein